jgi:hypothetical protein
MHKTTPLLAVATGLLVSTLNLNAASLAGVNLPDTTVSGDKSLVLNGLGLAHGVYGEGLRRGTLPAE